MNARTELLRKSFGLQGECERLLSALQALRQHHWAAHWQAQGANAYADHLLLEQRGR